jgi:hypothetical protein
LLQPLQKCEENEKKKKKNSKKNVKKRKKDLSNNFFIASQQNFHILTHFEKSILKRRFLFGIVGKMNANRKLGTLLLLLVQNMRRGKKNGETQTLTSRNPW